MSETLRAGLLFLVNTLFDLYLFVLVIRLVLVWVRSDYFNPVTQFVVNLTNIIVRPTRRFLPNIQQFETATVVWMFAIEIIKFFMISWLSFGIPNLSGLPVLALADMLYLLIQAFTYAIVLQAVLSFLQPMSPFAAILSRFTSPIMYPLQRIVPPMGGMNLTPIPALIILQLMNIILVNPLLMIGQNLAYN